MRSDVRRIRNLAGAMLAAPEPEVQLGFIALLVEALGEVWGPAFGGESGSREWAWAF